MVQTVQTVQAVQTVQTVQAVQMVQQFEVDKKGFERFRRFTEFKRFQSIKLVNGSNHTVRTAVRIPNATRTDWRRGDHRTACRVALLSDLANKDLTPRNLSFMRKLLHHDINAENSVLKLPTSSHYNFQALALESAVNPLVTVVDYRKGHPSAYITDANSARAGDLHNQINWDDHIARAARSGGRIELHLIRAQHGYSDGSERLLMMPQYSESPAIHQGLLDILRRDDGIANWEAEVKELFSRCEGILKVH
ncbi:hypothetical protein R3P38DRAFT_3459239 [Favolaschia claudopus]|uniref:Uncharacterized protein n=1 Tax=Favolaschia claudopus TaxID=2862362 RepID=A0AAV9ZJ28_9AGAR